MEKLAYLKSQYGHLPAQGTPEWLESRRTKIGGSEVASAIGECPYRKPTELVDCKKNQKFVRNAACTFGHVFEYVAKQVIKAEYAHEVHEMGAIPSSRWPVCYSPDGVIVDGDDLVLVEIKCPFRRSKIAEVPPHYLCQVQTGMSVLPCDRCNFYQFRFRICSIAQLGGSVKYNRWMHCESYKRAPNKSPIRWGFLHIPADTDLIDLGALSRDHEEKLCIINGLRNKLYFETKEMPFSGYVLPFKLFEMSLVEVPRDPAFLDKNGATLWKLHSDLV